MAGYEVGTCEDCDPPGNTPSPPPDSPASGPSPTAAVHVAASVAHDLPDLVDLPRSVPATNPGSGILVAPVPPATELVPPDTASEAGTPVGMLCLEDGPRLPPFTTS